MKSIKKDQCKSPNFQKKTRIKPMINRIIKDSKNEHEIQVRSRGASLIEIPSGYISRQNKTNKVKQIVKPINVGNRESDVAVDYLTLSSKSVTSRSTKEFLQSLEKPNNSESENERLGYKVFQDIEQGLYKNQPMIENKRKSSRDKRFARVNKDTNRRRFYRNLSPGIKARDSFSTKYRPKVLRFSIETDEDDSSSGPNTSKCNRWVRESSSKEQKNFATKMVRINNQDDQVDQWSQTSDSEKLSDTAFESHKASCSNSRSSASTRVRSSILKNKGTSKKLTKRNQSKVSSLKCELKSKTFTRKWSNKFQSSSFLPNTNESKFRRIDDIPSKFDVNGINQASIPTTNSSNSVQDRQSPASSVLNLKKASLQDKEKNLKMPGYFETKNRFSSSDLPKNMFSSNRTEFSSDSDDSKLKITPGYLTSVMKKSKTMRKEINTSGSDMSGLLSDEEPAKKLSRILMERRLTMQALQDCHKKTLSEKRLNRDFSNNDTNIDKNLFSSCLQPREEQHRNESSNEKKDSEKNDFQLEMEEINKKLELTMSSDVFKSDNYNSPVYKLLDGLHPKNGNKSSVSSPKFKNFWPDIPVLSVLTPIPEEVQDMKPYKNIHKSYDGETSGLSNTQNKFTGIKLNQNEIKATTSKKQNKKVIEKRVQSPPKSFDNDRITTNDGMPALLFNKAGFPLTDSKGRCLKNNLGVKMLPASSLKDIIDKKLQVYDAFNYPPTTISFDPTKQAAPAPLHDIRIFDKQFKPRVLYNSLGYPLSDNEGFLLRDNLGNYLVVLDNEGIPMCCANGEPIYMEDGKLWITEKESYDVLHRANEVSSFKQNEKRSVTINSEVKSVVYDTTRKATNLGPETSEKIKLDKSTLNYYKNLPSNFVARAKPKPRIIEEIRKKVARKKEKKADKNRNKTATSSEDTQRSSRKVFNKVPKGKKSSANFKKYLSLKKNFLKITSALPNLNLSEDSAFLSDVSDLPDTNVKKRTKKKQKSSLKKEKSDHFSRKNDESTNHWKESNSYILNLFLKSKDKNNNKADIEKKSNIPKKQNHESKNDEKISASIKDLNKNKLFSQKNSKDVKIDLAYVNRLKRARTDLNNAFDKLVTRKKSKETYSESDPETELLDKEWIKLMRENAGKNRY